MTRPLIGLSCYREPAAWGAWNQSADLLPSSYARSIEAAGGVPVVLPPTTPYDEAARAVLARLDGLVISGGADVDPGRYAEERHAATQRARPDRDAWEVALLAAAAERGVATLGVCRGMQVMAVAGGGALEQHLPDVLGSEAHDPGGEGFGPVEVRVEPGSRLAEVLDAAGAGLTVGCHHHQAVRTHPGLRPVAWAVDGSLEAVEGDGDRFLVGVQWHPEIAEDAGLFRGLVRASGGI